MAAGMNMSATKEIKTEYLTIQGNCLEMPDICVQLSNISLFTTSPVESAGLRVLLTAVILVIVGILLIGVNFLVGAATAAVGILLGYLWYTDWQKAKNSERLTIVTNSGITYSVVFGDKEFLKKVVAVITEIVREPQHRGKTIFNIKDNIIYGSAIGENASVHRGGT